MKTIIYTIVFFLSGNLYSQSSELNYKLKNSTIGNNLHTVNPLTKAHSGTTKRIANSLKGEVKISEDHDSLYINFWPIISNKFTGNPDTVNINDNGTTFAYEIINKVHIPFKGTALAKVSIPFRYRMTSDPDLEADFLNLGFTAMSLKGGTTFFRDADKAPRDWFFGYGGFVGFSGTELDSASTNGYLAKGEKKNIATVSYGLNVGFSYRKVSIIIALGFDNAIGKSAKHWEENNFTYGVHPWLGFGLGFDIFDFTIRDKQ